MFFHFKQRIIVKIKNYFLAPIFLSLSAYGQVKLNSQKTLRIEYESKAWNKSPSEVDHAMAILRDSETKKIVKVQLDETDKNSNRFIGYYSVSFGDKDIRPELYFPPQTLVTNSEALKKIETMISDGTLLRKPYFIKEENNSNIMAVFNSREEALAAFDKYRQQRLLNSGKVGSAALEAQGIAKKAAEEKARLDHEAQLLSDRQKLLEDEKKKQELLLKQQAEMVESEKKLRIEKSLKIASEGNAAYQKENFKVASDKFREATELDPSNNSFYFQYGVCAYRLDDYEKSIALLKMAKPLDRSAIEKDFFLGLNYMKTKEYTEAANSFENVKKTNDKQLAAPAAFYQAVLQFQKEDYESAKLNFEFVLDNSTDSLLDKQAETYIEQIANIQAFKKEQAKKMVLTMNGGLMYDSNILAIAKSQLDQQTQLAGYRWSYGFSLESRAIYTYENELSAILSVSDLYSTNSSFSSEKSFQDTDPLSMSLYFPFKYKGKVFEKGYQMTLNPGYETVLMNADTVGNRETILNSMVIKNDHTLVMDENWFSTYSLEFRQDVSKISSTNETDDDLNGSKWTLGTTQTFFQNTKKTEAWIGEFSYSNTTARGINNSNTKFDIAATYMAPLLSDMTWTGKLQIYLADYAKHSTGRKDTGTSVSFALQKPFGEKVSSSLSLSYTNNGSTRESSDYSKFIILTGVTWKTDLL